MSLNHRAMLDRADRTLSIRRQCALVGVARSSVYRPRRPANDNDVVPMRLISTSCSRPGRFSVRAA
jgi:putative transposase